MRAGRMMRMIKRWISMMVMLAGGVMAEERPNVLLICVDDLKPLLGAYGDPLAKTPNLDRLAERGMRFDLAYCNQAVCAASRNSLLLGSRCTSLGVYDLSVPFRRAVPDGVTLPQYFRKFGYKAEAVGKILHTGHGNRDDEASWSVPTVMDKVVEYRDPRNSADGRLTREEAFFSNRELGRIGQLPRGAAWEIGDVEDEAYADGRIATAAVGKLREAAADGRPRFLAVGFVKPHLPFTAPRKYWEMHDPTKFALAEVKRPPVGAPGFAGKRGEEIANYEPVPANGVVDEATARWLIHGYYASTSYMDAQLGRVLDELDRLDLAKKTIVVLWGDHGWHLGDHGWWTKHTNYEQANRIPLLIVAPGIEGGRSTRQLVETVDLYPTLVELAGLPAAEVPQPLDGVSLVEVLKDPELRLRGYATHCFPRGGRLGRAVRTERYRLIEWKRHGESEVEVELYDYQEDPGETENLAGEKQEVVEALRVYLREQPEAMPRPRAQVIGRGRR